MTANKDKTPIAKQKKAGNVRISNV